MLAPLYRVEKDLEDLKEIMKWILKAQCLMSYFPLWERQELFHGLTDVKTKMGLI